MSYIVNLFKICIINPFLSPIQSITVSLLSSIVLVNIFYEITYHIVVYRLGFTIVYEREDEKIIQILRL